MTLVPVADLVAAYPTKPGEQHGFAPIGTEVPHRFEESLLHDVFASIGFGHSRDAKSIQPGEVGFEKRFERFSFLSEYALHQLHVFTVLQSFHNDIHRAVRPCREAKSIAFSIM